MQGRVVAAKEVWMQLLPEFLYRVRTTGPLPGTSGSPRGERQYWIVSEAELEGERIRATLAAPGSDWMWVSDDGSRPRQKSRSRQPPQEEVPDGLGRRGSQRALPVSAGDLVVTGALV
jgi:hypothetical protein